MLKEVVNAVCSQNPMTLCEFLLQMIENTAVYIIDYLYICKKAFSDERCEGTFLFDKFFLS